MNCVRGINGPPSPGSVFSVTTKGEVAVFDPKVISDDATNEVKKMDGQFMQEIDIKDAPLPIVRILENGFEPGSLISISAKMSQGCQRFYINLQTGKPSLEADIALHFNPRLDGNVTILNSKRNGEWMVEEKQSLCVNQEDGGVVKAFVENQGVQIVIKSEEGFFNIFVNGMAFCRFAHRVKPEEITHVRLQGDFEPKALVYHSKSVRSNRDIWPFCSLV